VALDRGQTEDVEVGRLVEESGRPFRSGDAPNRLRLECVGEEDRAVLRLFVNGRRLVETTERPGLGRFVGLQFFVYSGRGGTDVRFDNLAVRELPSLGGSQASGLTSAPRTGLTSRRGWVG
jgi:hypothetical protein